MEQTWAKERMHRRAAKCGVKKRAKESSKQISRRPKRGHEKRVGVGIGQFLLWGRGPWARRAAGQRQGAGQLWD